MTNNIKFTHVTDQRYREFCRFVGCFQNWRQAWVAKHHREDFDCARDDVDEERYDFTLTPDGLRVSRKQRVAA